MAANGRQDDGCVSPDGANSRLTRVAHVGGLPVEEFLPSLAGAGAGLAVVRAWIAVHWRDKDGDR